MQSEKDHDALSGGNHWAVKIKQIQWDAFRKKLKQDTIPFEFEDIVVQVKTFLNPIALSLAVKKPPPAKWSPPGPWLF